MLRNGVRTKVRDEKTKFSERLVSNISKLDGCLSFIGLSQLSIEPHAKQEAYRTVLQIEVLNLFIPIQFLKIASPTPQKLQILQWQDHILRLKHPASQKQRNMGRVTV